VDRSRTPRGRPDGVVAPSTSPEDDPRIPGAASKAVPMATDPLGSRHRLLVVTDATCAGSELCREIGARADETETDVLIVAPVLTSRFRYWMSDEDAGTVAALRRLTASIEQCEAAGIAVRGALGDADPLAATNDAARTFDPDEIIIATWCIVCDLGGRLLIVVALWMLFHRRPRADRINY
jgi:hypothetical protein